MKETATRLAALLAALLCLPCALWAEEPATATTDLEQSEAAMFSELDRLTEKVFNEGQAPVQETPAAPAAQAGSQMTITMEDTSAPAPQGQEIQVKQAPAASQDENSELLYGEDGAMGPSFKDQSGEVHFQRPAGLEAETTNTELQNFESGAQVDRQDVLLKFADEAKDEQQLPENARFWEKAVPRADSLGKNVDKGLVEYDTDDGFLHTNVYIRLRDCISMGLEKNLGLTIERYKPEFQREGIRIAKGVFDPKFYLSANWGGGDAPRPYVKVQSYKLRTPTGTVNVPYNTKLHIGNTRTENYTFGAKIAGTFATGLQYEFSTGLTENWNERNGRTWGNPLYASENRVKLTMPLLRGFGVDVNMAPVRVARNNWRIAKESLDDYMQTFITEIMRYYWTLYYWREQTGAAEYTLELSKNLLYVTSSKRAVGLVASNEVIQAQARIASQEQALLSSRNAIRDSEDVLRQAINFQMNDLYRPKAMRPYQYHLVPLEKPQVTEVTLDETALIETALLKRKTLEVAKLQLKNAKENLKVAKSNLMPKLDAVTSVGISGVGNTSGNAINDVNTYRHPDWSIGMNFVIPFFFWNGVGAYRQAKYSKQQADLTVENVQQALVIEVRTAIRAVQTNRKRITATREATRLAYEQLYYEQEKYKAGLVTTYEVLEIQNDLATALSDEIKALVDWRISLGELSRVVGLALDYNDVVIDDYYKLPKKEESYFTRFLWQ